MKDVKDDDDDDRNTTLDNSKHKEQENIAGERYHVVRTTNHQFCDSLIEGTNEDDRKVIEVTNDDDDNNHPPQQILSWFQCAYLTPTATGNTTTTSLELQQPLKHCVRIVYDPSRQYYSLVATAGNTNRSHRMTMIPKGTILYTERPLFATQIPSSCNIEHNKSIDWRNPTTPSPQFPMSNGLDTQRAITKKTDQEYFKVRACQSCFRSLEPISSCYNCCSSKNNNLSRAPSDPSLLLPLQYLYPVPDFHFHTETTTSHDDDGKRPRCQVDQYGRILCTVCRSFFCSQQCYNRMIQQYGSCCLFLRHLQLVAPSNSTSTRAATAATNETRRHHRNYSNFNDNDTTDDDNGHSDIRSQNDTEAFCDEDANTDPMWEAMQQPAIALAVRMFVATLHQYRSVANTAVSTTAAATDSVSLITSVVDGLCGTAEDVQLLELGLPIRMNANSSSGIMEEFESMTVQYTVEPIYDMLVFVHSITKVEQAKQFTLMYLMSLCSKAARNGFGVRPQSPFQSYYAGIVRTSLFRGSTQHTKFQTQIANALLGCASSDVQFQRGMDRMIDDCVCPEVVALFPLTSRINHSCVPNAEVRSQQYIDDTIDVVAIQDIKVGEEITISYIYGTGRSCSSTGSDSSANEMTLRQRNPKTTHRRQLELYAKYLFHCGCLLCTNEEIKN